MSAPVVLCQGCEIGLVVCYNNVNIVAMFSLVGTILLRASIVLIVVYIICVDSL